MTGNDLWPEETKKAMVDLSRKNPKNKSDSSKSNVFYGGINKKKRTKFSQESNLANRNKESNGQSQKEESKKGSDCSERAMVDLRRNKQKRTNGRSGIYKKRKQWPISEGRNQKWGSYCSERAMTDLRRNKQKKNDRSYLTKRNEENNGWSQ